MGCVRTAHTVAWRATYSTDLLHHLQHAGLAPRQAFGLGGDRTARRAALQHIPFTAGSMDGAARRPTVWCLAGAWLPWRLAGAWTDCWLDGNPGELRHTFFGNRKALDAPITAVPIIRTSWSLPLRSDPRSPTMLSLIRDRLAVALLSGAVDAICTHAGERPGFARGRLFKKIESGNGAARADAAWRWPQAREKYRQAKGNRLKGAPA